MTGRQLAPRIILACDFGLQPICIAFMRRADGHLTQVPDCDGDSISAVLAKIGAAA